MQLKYNELQQILTHLRKRGEFIPSVPLNSKRELLEAELDKYNEGHWTHEEEPVIVKPIIKKSNKQSAVLPSNNDLSVDRVAGMNDFTKALYNKLIEVEQFYLSLNI